MYVCVYIYNAYNMYIYIYIIFLYISTLFSHKKNGIFTFSTTWMDIEGIMISEIIRHRKLNKILFHLHVESKKSKRN